MPLTDSSSAHFAIFLQASTALGRAAQSLPTCLHRRIAETLTYWFRVPGATVIANDVVEFINLTLKRGDCSKEERLALEQLLVIGVNKFRLDDATEPVLC